MPEHKPEGCVVKAREGDAVPSCREAPFQHRGIAVRKVTSDKICVKTILATFPRPQHQSFAEGARTALCNRLVCFSIPLSIFSTPFAAVKQRCNKEKGHLRRQNGLSSSR